MNNIIQEKLKEFEEKFPKEKCALIWHKAFVENMKQIGVPPKLDMRYFKSLGQGIIKQSLHQALLDVLKEERQTTIRLLKEALERPNLRGSVENLIKLKGLKD